MRPEPDSPIAIFTIDRDIHAYAVRHEIRRRGAECAIIEIDALTERGGMSWSLEEDPIRTTVCDVDGLPVTIGDLQVIWWRRFNAPPRLPDTVTDEAARDLIGNECRATLFGMALTDFPGRWVSHPEATRRAENKLVQLRAARAAGLRVPRTLVSQDPETVRTFVADVGGEAIAKVVQGTHATPLLAGRVTAATLDDRSIRLCPAIYQELIPGTRHLRVCMFGDAAHTVMLETDRLDWRLPLDATATIADLEPETSRAARRALDALGLEMGIADIKVTPEGEPVWLEVNPQGQFMFLEAMTDLPVIEIFADYLLSMTRQGIPATMG